MTSMAITTVITTQMSFKRTCRAALSRKTRTVDYAGKGLYEVIVSNGHNLLLRARGVGGRKK